MLWDWLVSLVKYWRMS